MLWGHIWQRAVQTVLLAERASSLWQIVGTLGRLHDDAVACHAIGHMVGPGAPINKASGTARTRQSGSPPSIPIEDFSSLTISTEIRDRVLFVLPFCPRVAPWLSAGTGSISSGCGTWTDMCSPSGRLDNVMVQRGCDTIAIFHLRVSQWTSLA